MNLHISAKRNTYRILLFKNIFKSPINRNIITTSLLIMSIFYSTNTFANKEITSTTIYNKYIYIGLNNPTAMTGDKGELYKCTTGDSISCQKVDSFSYGVTSVIPLNSYIYVATIFGYIEKCTYNTVGDCSVFASAGSNIQAFAADSYYLYAGLSNGSILKYDSLNSHTYKTLVSAAYSNANIYSMILYDGSLYTGTVRTYEPVENTLNKCDSFVSNDCSILDYFSNPLYNNIVPTALVGYNYNGSDYIYTALSDGKIQKCDKDNANSCTTIVDLNPTYINTLAVESNYVYTPVSSGIEKCASNSVNSCEVIKYNFGSETIFSSLIYNGYLYLGGTAGNLYRCSINAKSNSCTKVATFT